MRSLAASAALLVLSACAAAPRAPRPDVVAFRYGPGKTLLVPVTVGTETVPFALDTGAGLELVSKPLCEKMGCVPAGRYIGRRMSGQSIEVPLARLPALSFGPITRRDVIVGVLDWEEFGEDAPLRGLISLRLLEKFPFTVDYAGGRIVLEDEASLARRAAAGVATTVRVDRDSATVAAFLPVSLPRGATALMEIDSGSGSLILDDSYMARLGVSADAAGVRKAVGEDESGHPFVRRFTALAGPVSPSGAESMPQSDVPVMFQRIIYDGLVGDAFLSRYTVTYDLPRSRLIFARR
jgi:hypothetical protein